MRGVLITMLIFGWFFWTKGPSRLYGPFESIEQCETIRNGLLDVPWHKRWLLPERVEKCFEA